MRYFVTKYDRAVYVVIVNTELDFVTFYPHTTYLRKETSFWLHYYNNRLDYDNGVFEICENQFNKFKDKGVLPINYD